MILPRRLLRCVVAVLLPLLLVACDVAVDPPGPSLHRTAETDGAFVMRDGTRLPYRAWLPGGDPWAVVLALHGMNDSRDAWEYPAPEITFAGVAMFSPDQRGFGATDTRGYWPGADGMANDARTMVGLLRARYPHVRLYLMGESMGGAVLMQLATQPNPPPVDGYIVIAPAVWGRAEMNVFLRASLWVASNTVPGLRLTGAGIVRVTASDNRPALRRLSNDPLTIHGTRVDAVRGLVDLMDDALAAAPRFHARSLFLYGGHDELIPPRATAATWRALPPGPVRAFYPEGYHLLLRDIDRITPIDDILAWMRDPAMPLPSGADRAAAAWLAQQSPP
ncbi:MAG: alpha/beta fold hydrolase [Acetobacteraceae bacterium]|nr:alpha/beta fold hydrolase [Acetobacteraceae bacterium]